MAGKRCRWAGILGACMLLLAGCAEVQLAAHTAKGMRGRDEASVPGYKVGRPYQVAGLWYTPKEDFAYNETGIASWYGPGFHGKLTANGERYDQNALTAAHPTLPMPSLVQVTNLENGRSIRLRVNDRGPYKNGRIIDVSRRAANLLGFSGQGTARVRVEILADESRQLAAAARGGAVHTAEASPDSGAVPLVPVSVSPLAGPGQVPAAAQLAERTPAPQPDGQVTQLPVTPSAIFIQAGAFTQSSNAQRLAAELSGFGRVRISEAAVGPQRFYRVQLGPLATVEEADGLLARLIAGGYRQSRVTVE